MWKNSLITYHRIRHTYNRAPFSTPLSPVILRLGRCVWTMTNALAYSAKPYIKAIKLFYNEGLRFSIRLLNHFHFLMEFFFISAIKRGFGNFTIIIVSLMLCMELIYKGLTYLITTSFKHKMHRWTCITAIRFVFTKLLTIIFLSKCTLLQVFSTCLS